MADWGDLYGKKALKKVNEEKISIMKERDKFKGETTALQKNVSSLNQALVAEQEKVSSLKKEIKNLKEELERISEERAKLAMWKDNEEQKIIARQNEKPWRQCHLDWTENTYRTLLQSVREYKPSNTDTSSVRILFLGEIGAGKSSTINTFMSAIQGDITQIAYTASKDRSVTTQLKIYPVSKDIEEANIEFIDVMGMEGEEDKGLLQEDVDKIMKGHIPDQYCFNEYHGIDHKTPGFIGDPSIREQVHVVAIVVNSNSVDVLEENIKAKIKKVKNYAEKRGIRIAIILTHIDELSVDMVADVCKVHSDPDVKAYVKSCAMKFGVIVGNIFPMKNYSDDIEVTLDTNILALHTLKSLLKLAEDTLQHQRETALKDPPLLSKSWRTGAETFEEEESDQLKNEIADMDISEPDNVRILLLGPHNSGKSSFINTIQSAFFNSISDKVAVHPNQSEVITTEFREYLIRTGKHKGAGTLKLKLFDTMGLHDTGLHIKDIRALLDGKVKIGYQFNPAEPISSNDSVAVAENIPHILAVVLNGSTIKTLATEISNELIDTLKLSLKKGLGVVILLTHIENCCSHIQKDLNCVYYSAALRNSMSYVSEKYGVKMNNIYPIKNYVAEHQTDITMDILALRALKHTMEKAMETIEELKLRAD